MKKKWLAAVWIFALWFLIHLTCITVDGLSDELGKADVAIVLGNKVEKNGQPSDRLASRLDKTIELYKEGFFSYVIVSGGIGAEGFDEAQVMKDYLIGHGIPSASILTDNQGVNTAKTAKNAKAIMDAKGFGSAMVITQFYHVSRTKLALSQMGVQTTGSAHADYFEARDLYSLVREFFAYYTYLLLKV